MWIDCPRQERVNKILTLPEWINIVKQLGMMHIIYYMTRHCYHLSHTLYKTFGYKAGQPDKNWEHYLYRETNTERKLIDFLDRWEKEYEKEWHVSKSFLNMK
jgi:hypothetical protein